MREISNIVKINLMKRLMLIQVSNQRNRLRRTSIEYAEAIETCPSQAPEELSQFYQNRAAAWESLVNIDCNSIFK